MPGASHRGTTGSNSGCNRQPRSEPRDRPPEIFPRGSNLPARSAGKGQFLAIPRQAVPPRSLDSRRRHRLASTGDPATGGVEGEEPNPVC